MDSSQNQPLPPGVGTWPPPNHPPQFHSDPQSYHPPFDTRHDTASGNNSDSAANIESAVQEAVLHAQVYIYPDYIPRVAVMFLFYWLLVIWYLCLITRTLRPSKSYKVKGVFCPISFCTTYWQLLDVSITPFPIRYANTTSEPTSYGEDLLSNRRDPNALKVIDDSSYHWFFYSLWLWF